MEAILVAIGAVALAEMGDKTQLLAFLLASRFKKPTPIILGILVATIFRKLCKIRNFSQSPFGGFISEESDGNFPSGRN